GYTCRVLRPGEEPAWAQVLNDCGQLGVWDEERVDRALGAGIARERIWFLCADDQPVATACVCLQGEAAFGAGCPLGSSDRGGPDPTPNAEPPRGHPTPNA